ncbi:MAG: hypothetical protein M1832_000837 [Thelocarpon impressellum]|nr:MAG: hypothetical protein M1832_000837 [Thelocarpon impressellum]
MLLTNSLVQSALVLAALAGQRAHVAAYPASTPGKWEVQEGASAECSFKESKDATSASPVLSFSVSLHGFGSRDSRPGDVLREQLRAAGNGPIHDGDWQAKANGETGADVLFTIPATEVALSGVETAIEEASDRKVGGLCTRKEARR